MEFFTVGSRIVPGGKGRPGDAEFALRLQAALLKRAPEAFGPRWRGPLHEPDESSEASGPLRPRDYDDIVSGADRLVIVAGSPREGAPLEVRAALHRAARPDADFPPVFVTPDAESVRSGALDAALRTLGVRRVPALAVDLLGVPGSAIPQAIRTVTSQIARASEGSNPSRWIVLLDPIHEAQIRRWSDPNLFGSVRITRTRPIDLVSLRVETSPGPGSVRTKVTLQGSLAWLCAGIAHHGELQAGLATLREDVARVGRLLDGAIESPLGGSVLETERVVEVHRHAQGLLDLILGLQAETIEGEEFVDRATLLLSELRAEEPVEATHAAELVSAKCGATPFDPVPLPEGARHFVETLGPPPTVQRLRPLDLDGDPTDV